MITSIEDILNILQKVLLGLLVSYAVYQFLKYLILRRSRPVNVFRLQLIKTIKIVLITTFLWLFIKFISYFFGFDICNLQMVRPYPGPGIAAMGYLNKPLLNRYVFYLSRPINETLDKVNVSGRIEETPTLEKNEVDKIIEIKNHQNTPVLLYLKGWYYNAPDGWSKILPSRDNCKCYNNCAYDGYTEVLIEPGETYKITQKIMLPSESEAEGFIKIPEGEYRLLIEKPLFNFEFIKLKYHYDFVID